MKDLFLNEASKQLLQYQKNNVDNFSGLSFIGQHNGFRNGKLHLFLGTAGAGKSTLVRTILNDYLDNNAGDALVYLSEETLTDFASAIYQSNFDGIKGRRIQIMSEVDFLVEDGFKMNADFLFRKLSETDASIIIFDNITTSMLYNDKKPDEQSDFVHKLKVLAHRINKPILLIAHTSANVNRYSSGLISENDIRGSKSITNYVEFLYILQVFEVGESRISTIRNIKARDQETPNPLHILFYNHKYRIYSVAEPYKFEDFKEAFSKRNKL
jgi:archaellum biogenesis ATPase FlaH